MFRRNDPPAPAPRRWQDPPDPDPEDTEAEVRLLDRGDRRRPTPSVRPGAEADSTTMRILPGMALCGALTGCETLIVGGEAEPKLDRLEVLVVEAGGAVKGEIEVQSRAEIAGTMEGTLIVHGTLEIKTGGTVRGAVTYEKLSVQEGGTIVGDVRSEGPERQRPGEPAGDNGEAAGGPA